MKLLMGFIVLLVALVAVTGCTQTASPPAPTPTPTTIPVTTVIPTPNAITVPTPVTTMTWILTPTPGAMVTTIHLTSAGFTPQTDVVLPGTGVSFMNNDNVTHTIIGIGNSTGMFNSGPVIPGAAFQYTFSEYTGVLYYGLADNANMTGTITVQPPSGASTYSNKGP